MGITFFPRHMLQCYFFREADSGWRLGHVIGWNIPLRLSSESTLTLVLSKCLFKKNCSETLSQAYEQRT